MKQMTIRAVILAIICSVFCAGLVILCSFYAVQGEDWALYPANGHIFTNGEITRAGDITDRNGKTYSEDMQVVTGNAASAIAFRNAVLKVVPKAVTKRVINEIKEVALGKSIDLETRRQRMVQYFTQIGVTQSELLTYCGVNSIEQIDANLVFELRGLANAIKEGTTSVQETFKANTADSKAIADSARKAVEAKKDKIAQAMNQATGATAQAETVDPETGEIIQPVTENPAPKAESKTNKSSKEPSK